MCELIVLDEPTTAMDVETRRLFGANMKAEVAEGRTLLFATHYLEEADQAADRILVINKGRLWPTAPRPRSRNGPGPSGCRSGSSGWTSRSCSACPASRVLSCATIWCRFRPGTPTPRSTPCSTPAYRPTEIEVASLGLEQAFIAITAEDDRANDAPAPVRVARRASTSKEMSDK